MPPISESQRAARIKAVHEHFRIENTHDLDAVMATFGTTCSFRANNELHEGRDAVRAFYGEFFRGFPALESVTAKAGAGLLTCEMQRPEGRPAAQTCRFNGAPMAALQKDGDRYQLDVPASLLAGQPSLELRWIDQWR